MKDRNIKNIFKKIAITVVLMQTPINADYCATGKIEANVCTSYLLFESCKFTTIDAVRDIKGGLYNINKCYQSVDEYKTRPNKKPLCSIRTKAQWFGVFNAAIDAARTPVFLHKNSSGKYDKVDPDYLVFECIEK